MPVVRVRGFPSCVGSCFDKVELLARVTWFWGEEAVDFEDEIAGDYVSAFLGTDVLPSVVAGALSCGAELFSLFENGGGLQVAVVGVALFAGEVEVDVAFLLLPLIIAIVLADLTPHGGGWIGRGFFSILVDFHFGHVFVELSFILVIGLVWRLQVVVERCDTLLIPRRAWLHSRLEACQISRPICVVIDLAVNRFVARLHGIRIAVVTVIAIVGSRRNGCVVGVLKQFAC